MKKIIETKNIFDFKGGQALSKIEDENMILFMFSAYERKNGYILNVETTYQVGFDKYIDISESSVITKNELKELKKLYNNYIL